MALKQIKILLEISHSGEIMRRYFVVNGIALVIIFLLGVFLGRVGGTFWLWSGLQSLTVALLTLGLIYLVA